MPSFRVGPNARDGNGKDETGQIVDQRVRAQLGKGSRSVSEGCSRLGEVSKGRAEEVGLRCSGILCRVNRTSFT